MASDTQQTRSRQIRLESFGVGCRRVGTCLRNCSCGCSPVHNDDEYDTHFSQEKLAIGDLCKQYRSSKSFGASPTVSAGHGTGADDDNRMQVDSIKKGKG